MRRTKLYVPAAKAAAPAAVLERPILRAAAGPAPKPAPTAAPSAGAVRQTEVNHTADHVAAGIVEMGRPIAAGRVELVAPGAVYAPPPGMDLRCFLHRDGSAVKFAGAAGDVYLDRGEAQAEFGPLLRAAMALLAAHPAPARQPAPAKQPAAKKPAAPPLRRSAETTTAPGADAADVVRTAGHSRGAPLSASSRAKLEASFGADLGGVRVHTDTAAGDAAHAVHAHAFTTGQDIYFRAGQYNPGTAAGEKLLAHEVAHTVQQGDAVGAVARAADGSELEISEPGDRLEREAEAAAEAAGAKEKPAAGAAPGKGGKGEAKAGPGAKAKPQAGAGGAEKTAEGPEAAGPAPDAGLQAVVGQVKSAAVKQKAHPPATAKAAEASAAAKGPPNEVAALAAGRQVGTMHQQEVKPFDRKAFLGTLLGRIDSVAPQTLEEADEFKEQGKVGQLKGELTQQVGAGNEAAQGNVAAAAKAEPTTAGLEPKQAVEIAPAPPAPAAEVAAAKAAPPPAPEQAVSLADESKKLDDQMASGDVTREQLEKSNEPAFQKAVADKDEAQAQAEQAPRDYRASEQATLAAAKAENQTAVAKQLSELAGSRDRAMGQVLTAQTTAKGADETKRAEITQGIQSIYEQTKKDVDERLAKLDADVNAAFDAAASNAQKVFENHVDDRMTQYKDERYEGVTGKGRWVKDKFLGLPDEVNKFYAEGKQKYVAEMRAAMDGIATLVEQGITEAKAKVADGKKKVDEYVHGQPKELQEIARQAAEGFKDKFDQLEQGVDDRQNQIVDGLVSRYQEKLKELDDRIAAMKAENGGLLGAVMAAVGGVIQTILELKAMLLGVLAKAQEAVGLIIKDPIGFLGNLASGVKQGLMNFVSNIGAHLQAGLFAWLFGTLAQAGIQVPDKFDLAGVLGVVLQMLGLTYANIRKRAVAIVGEKVVSALETASEIFVTLITKGVSGLWEYIKEKASDLIQSVLDGIKSFLIDKVIMAGVTWIIGLLNPASAFVKACKAIYDLVMFFVERGQQIVELVNAVLDSVLSIAKGDVTVAAKAVEKALAKAVPVAIGFLAGLLGLGGLSEKIKEVIAKIQAPINSAIDWVIKKAVQLVKTVGTMLGLGGKKEPKSDTPEAALVKGKALEEARQQLGTRRFASIDAIHQELEAIETKYRPEGLKRLSLRIVNEESMLMSVEASASEPDNYELKLSDAVKPGEIGAEELKRLKALLAEQGETTHAALVYNGRLLGKRQSRNDIHAEERLIAVYWNQATQLAISDLKSGKSTRPTIALLINRTPCSAECVPTLNNAAINMRREAEQAGVNPEAIHLLLAPTGDYHPTGPAVDEQTLAAYAQFVVDTLQTTVKQALSKYVQKTDPAIGEATTVPDLAALGRYWEVRVLVVGEAPSHAGERLKQTLRRIFPKVAEELTHK